MKTIRNYFFALCAAACLVSCGQNEKQSASFTAYHTMVVGQYEAEQENEWKYKDLMKRSITDSVNGRKNYEAGIRIRKASSDMVIYLRAMQSTLVAAAEGIEKRVADTLRVEKLHEPMETGTVSTVMMKGRKGLELKSKLQQLHQFLASVSPNSYQQNSIRTLLETEDQPYGDNTMASWEERRFKDQSLIGVLTTLEGLILRVRFAESNALDMLLEGK